MLSLQTGIPCYTILWCMVTVDIRPQTVVNKEWPYNWFQCLKCPLPTTWLSYLIAPKLPIGRRLLQGIVIGEGQVDRTATTLIKSLLAYNHMYLQQGTYFKPLKKMGFVRTPSIFTTCISKVHISIRELNYKPSPNIPDLLIAVF
jgi:hypothetical protein